MSRRVGWLLGGLLLAASCAPERQRNGRDLAVGDGDLAVEETADLRGADLQKGKDGTVNDLDHTVDLPPGSDLASATGDLAFPGTDLRDNALVPGDTCSDAPLLPIGVLVGEQSTDSASLHDDYNHFGAADLGSTPCNSLRAFQYDAQDAVYKVVVPSKKTLRVQAQSQLGWDLALALFTDCGAPAASCVADADDALPIGQPEQVEYVNATGLEQTVFILVDGWDTPEKGPFTIQAALQ